MFNMFSRKNSKNLNIILLDQVTCSSNHTFLFKPSVVLSPAPCAGNMFSTDEPLFMFWATGRTAEEVQENLGNQICHFYQLYDGLDESILKEFPVMAEIQSSFFGRVHEVVTDKDDGDRDNNEGEDKEQ